MKWDYLSLGFLFLGMLAFMFIPLFIDLQDIENTITKSIILGVIAILNVIMAFVSRKKETGE